MSADVHRCQPSLLFLPFLLFLCVLCGLKKSVIGGRNLVFLPQMSTDVGEAFPQGTQMEDLSKKPGFCLMNYPAVKTGGVSKSPSDLRLDF